MSAHLCVSPERIYVYTNNRGGSESSSAMQLCVTRNRYGFAYLLPSVTVFESSLKLDFWLPLHVENSTTLFTTHGNVKIYIGGQKDLCRCYYPFLIKGFGLFNLFVILCFIYIFIYYLCLIYILCLFIYYFIDIFCLVYYFILH